MRPQHIRAKCGNCGKKMAWDYRYTFAVTIGPIHEVRCSYCKTVERFSEWDCADLGMRRWPGSLEAAAALLANGGSQEQAQPETGGDK